MQIQSQKLSDTSFKLTVKVSSNELAPIRQVVLARLSKDAKLSGFRAGKAPLNLVEKQLDQSVLQTEFLDEAINKFYAKAVIEQKLHPVAQPKIQVSKFVPFEMLEFDAEVQAVGELKLPDYKKLKLAKKPVTITAQEVNEVLDRLRTQTADKQTVKRVSKDGDEMVIDFSGVDAKTKEPISGADGKDFPLIIGSNTFIPGFEPELIGLKAGETKTFTITFPEDYAIAALKNRAVTFAVTAKNVSELKEDKLDDAFAAKAGPFKTLNELKADIKKQLTSEHQREAERAYENELVAKIADQTTVVIPEILIDEQLDAMEVEEKQNLAYRGQTWQEHLKSEGINDAQHRDRERPMAESRVKMGLVLSEIAEKERIEVTPEELEIRVQVLKGQYQDAAMQAELDKPEGRRDVMSRILTEKTLDKLKSYSTK